MKLDDGEVERAGRGRSKELQNLQQGVAAETGGDAVGGPDGSSWARKGGNGKQAEAAGRHRGLHRHGDGVKDETGKDPTAKVVGDPMLQEGPVNKSFSSQNKRCPGPRHTTQVAKVTTLVQTCSPFGLQPCLCIEEQIDSHEARFAQVWISFWSQIFLILYHFGIASFAT